MISSSAAIVAVLCSSGSICKVQGIVFGKGSVTAFHPSFGCYCGVKGEGFVVVECSFVLQDLLGEGAPGGADGGSIYSVGR